MFAQFRVGCVAALVTLASVALSSIPASAAGKAFQRAELDEAAIKLEAEIKNDAGTGRQTAGAIAARGRRRVPEERFPQRHGAARPDHRPGARRQRHLAAARPRHSAGPRGQSTAIAWRSSSAQAPPPTSPISAPRTAARRPTRCVIVGRSFGDRQVWRPALDALRLSLELREVADVRALYEKMREDHGFRLLDYTVDADSASPRACFQFSEDAAGQARRFLAVRRRCRPGQARALRRRQAALRRRAQARRALQHRPCAPAFLRPSRRRCRSPPTSPSMCATASRWRASPARPMCCRAPASAASRWSASTPRRSAIDVYRIGDRNLIETVLGRDFQRNLYRYEIERLTEQPRRQGLERRACGRADAQRRHHHRFPGRSGDRRHGARRLCDDGGGRRARRPTIPTRMSTQWFIVSDMGLAAFSGNDGINVFVNSLATTEPKGAGRGAADVARQRNPRRPSRPTRPAASPSRPGCRAARARCRPRCWSRPTPRATTRSSI